MKKSLFTWLTLFIIAAFKVPTMNQISIKIDATNVQHTMKGGMGASWHAIRDIHPLNNHLYKYPVREKAPLGSAYGGNPPIDDSTAWNQLLHHASWLGMNFVRVELSQHMYEPQRNQFTWESEEMIASYRILDWAEANKVDVFLQQMCMNVEWNSIPGVHPLISAPKDLEDYVEGIMALLHHLINQRSYTCIKYFCMTNEPPGGTWGYWWEYGDTEGNINDAWSMLAEAIKQSELEVLLAGPDWTDMPPFDIDKLEDLPKFDAYDIHSYHGVGDEGEENLKRWSSWVHEQGKPFLLTELGNMNLGWGGNDPGPSTFEAALSNADDIIRGMKSDVDGFNRWSFTNLGNLDGQWQLVRTYDVEKGEYLKTIEEEPLAYYGFGIISRFLSKQSSVLTCESARVVKDINFTAVTSPNGHLSVFMVNKGKEDVQVKIEIEHLESEEIYLYVCNQKVITEAGYQMNPQNSFAVNDIISFDFPAESICTLSTSKLMHKDLGVFIN